MLILNVCTKLHDSVSILLIYLFKGSLLRHMHTDVEAYINKHKGSLGCYEELAREGIRDKIIWLFYVSLD